MILFLHNRYRTTGGEERAVEDLLWLVREHLGEEAELLERDSAVLGRSSAAAGLLRGGLRPEEVARAVRRTRARVLHAHNVNPAFGWRALAAARDAGARVVLHLHQYRLVCAVGVCFTDGEDCTRCHGRNTLPGVVHRCRGSWPEAVVYAAGLALWQRRLATQVDRVIVPSRFALERLRELRAPVGEAQIVPQLVRSLAGGAKGVPAPAAETGPYAIVTARLAPEKGIDVAIEACRQAGLRLLVAGEGPARARLEAVARQGARPGGQPLARFLGQLSEAALAPLRRGAAVALMPSRSGETFGLAAAEAMAAGVPVIASRVGALPELVPADWLVPPGDPAAMARAIERVRGEPGAGERARRRAGEVCAPEAVARALATVYGSG